MQNQAPASINTEEDAVSIIQNSSDAGNRYHAAWWLGNQKAIKAVPLLCDCLNDKKDQTALGGFPLRRQAARSLGLIQDKAAIPALIDALKQQDLRLHEAIILALKAIDDEDVVKALIQYFQTEGIDKPYEVLIGTLAHFKAWDAKELVEPFLKNESERLKGIAAAYFFGINGEESYLNILIGNLNNENRYIRESAAFDLASLKQFMPAEKIINANISNNVKLISIKQILEAILLEPDSNQQEKPARINYLLQAIEDLLSDAIEGNIQWSEGMGKRESLISDLENNLNSEPSEEHLADLFNDLKSGNYTNKSAAIKELTAIGMANIDLITEAFDTHGDQDVKAGLIQVMLTVGNPKTLPQLEQAIDFEISDHCQGKLRRVATLALGNITNPELEQETLASIIKNLHWLLEKPDDWGMRYCSVISIEKTGTEEAMSTMKLAEENEPDIVVKARMRKALDGK